MSASSLSLAEGNKRGLSVLRAHSPITVLVVDDNPVDRHLAGTLVRKQTEYEVVYARNGIEALEAIKQEAPAVVLTDISMPGMDGLELVEIIRSRHPLIPVILMTANGSEEIAIKALQKGAASYVPKMNLTQEIAATIDQVLEAAKEQHRHRQLLGCLTGIELHFELENNPALMSAQIGHLQGYLTSMNLCDQTGRTRVGIALEEALKNALYHGNLELSSQLLQDGKDTYYRLAEVRSQMSPYQERRIHVDARLSKQEAVYTIRDEGPGFDRSRLCNPTDPENLGKLSGRGLLLIRTFMDDVSHNSQGNEIILVKRRDLYSGE
jgi:CheY-like chemotaxis protein/anti-sigma regulatory factor (Ser/Thr protein kinase)